MPLLDLCRDVVGPPSQDVRCGHAHHSHLPNCPTPEDLSDVVVDHSVEVLYGFRGQPREHLHRPLGDPRMLLPLFFEEAERCLAIADAIEHFNLDVDTLARLRDEYLNSAPRGGHNAIADSEAERVERGDLVREMVAGGMTLRQIVRYLGRSEREVVEAALGTTTTSGGDVRATAIVECDEQMRVGGLTINFLARYHALRHSVVTELAKMQRGWSR